MGMDNAPAIEEHGRWKDKDPRRACRICARRGLRYGSKTNICVTCFRTLPQVVKVSGTTELAGVVGKYARQAIDRFGLGAGAKLLGVDAKVLAAAARGEVVFAVVKASGGPGGATAPRVATVVSADGAPHLVADIGDALADAPAGDGPATGAADHPSPPTPAIAHPFAALHLDPELAERLLQHCKDLTPLPPAAARLIAPWRKPLRIELARELPGPRLQRLNRAAARARVLRYVPRLDARDPRPGIPLRICMGLWGLGCGAKAIARIAERARCATSKSSIGRLFKQAQTPFPGAERVEAGELARALDRRPLPAALGGRVLELQAE